MQRDDQQVFSSIYRSRDKLNIVDLYCLIINNKIDLIDRMVYNIFGEKLYGRKRCVSNRNKSIT